MKTENLPNFKIHKLSNEQYNNLVKNGEVDNTAFYLTPPPSFEGLNIAITDDESANKITFEVAEGTTSQKGIVQLSNEVSETEDTKAATPKGVVRAMEELIVPVFKSLNTSSPATSGTATEFIDTVSQENGKITATKKSVPVASIETAGIVQLNDSINSDSTTQAATAGAVKKAVAQITTELNKLNTTDPSSTGTETATSFIATAKQVNGKLEVTKAMLPVATTLATGITMLTNVADSAETTKAATPQGVSAAFAANYITTGRSPGFTIGNSATAEGYDVIATGDYSHAGGKSCKASDHAAFAHGSFLNAVRADQFVIGRCNVACDDDTLFIIGNGAYNADCTAASSRSNAFEVLADGRARVMKSSVTSSSATDEDVVNKKALIDYIDNIKRDLYSGLFPVGSIYTSRVPVDVASLIGGTWQLIAAASVVLESAVQFSFTTRAEIDGSCGNRAHGSGVGFILTFSNGLTQEQVAKTTALYVEATDSDGTKYAGWSSPPTAASATVSFSEFWAPSNFPDSITSVSQLTKVVGYGGIKYPSTEPVYGYNGKVESNPIFMYERIR